MRRPAPLLLLTALLACTAPAAPAHAQATLRAGAGQADITPPQTGYYLGGWTRADRLARGAHTRLFAKVLVLQRGGRKVALVAIELFMVPSGLHQHIARAVADRGFDERNVLMSATHTHAGPGGFANFPTYNTAAPSTGTATDPASFMALLAPGPPDQQLYAFLVQRIALAIRRADDDLGAAAAGWGSATLDNLTQNRSVEAHLADHGIEREFGQGGAAEDPEGAVHTIDPAVDVLRVDKLRRGRRVPIGAWSMFANHGTVVKAEFEAYTGDHHAAAHRVFEAKVRRLGRVPDSQQIVNVYGNGNEGDQTAGLVHSGPAGAEEVGRIEAAAMLRAWRGAGRALSRRPALDLRWTRVCFCGQQVEGGAVASQGQQGIGFLTGSEEGRGPLFDITGVPFEGRRNETGFGSQGHKIAIPAGEFPNVAPLMVVRVGDRAIATLPGEPTKEVGARVSAAVLAAADGAGITRVAVAGLANEYLSYITTPEEYTRQHYEGAGTLFGQFESNLLKQTLADLASRMARGEPAPDPAPFDPTHGVVPEGPAYPPGAPEGRITRSPTARVERLGQAVIGWRGAPAGNDLPADRAFLRAERRVRGRWRQQDSDLGLAMLWRVSDENLYTAAWEVPRDAPEGIYRFVVTAARYRLVSRSFEVAATGGLTVTPVESAPGTAAVELAYPRARRDVSLTARPVSASGGVVRFVVGERYVTVRRRKGARFTVPAPPGVPVSVPSGDAHDRHGNFNRRAARVR